MTNSPTVAPPDALSITAAARDASDALALIVGDERYSFGVLADAVARASASLLGAARQDGVFPVVATNTLDTVLKLFAAFEAGVPVLLLHPRAMEAERASQIEAALRTAPTLPSDAALILFTSGTTGAPRGAVLTRSALIASARASAANLGWQHDDCWLLAMPIARIGGLSILTRCLAARRAVALAPGFDAVQLPQWIDAARTTLVSLVPTMAALLFEQHPAWRAPPFLRALLLGGAAASSRLLAEAARRHVPVMLTYGCTETCSQVVATPYERRFDSAGCGVGRALAGAEVRVVDGQIEVRGPMRMSGYLGAAPLDPQAWFDTGDVGEFDADGSLHLLARRVDLIVSGGEKIYPAEVERVLEECPGIRAAAVFGVPDETWGAIVAAAVVIEEGAWASERLPRYVVERLAPHKRPRRVAIVDRLPQTAAGKLDRASLSTLADRLQPLTSTSVRNRSALDYSTTARSTTARG